VLGGGGAATGIESETDVSIKVNLSDSTQRIWQFGEDGNLTFPSGMTMGDLDGVEGIRGGVDSTIGILSQGTSGASVLQWVDDFEEATAVAAVVVNSLFAPNTGTVQIFTGDVGPAPEHSWTFGTDGALTLPTGGHIGPSGGKGAGTTYGGANDHLVSLTSYYNSGLYSSCVTAYADGTLNITAYNDGGPNPAKIWTFDNTGTLTFPDNTVQTTAYKSTSGSWTLATGSNTVSITVPLNGNYQMWVNGNVPNGIVEWNATVNVSNPNVPAIGSQYAWYYAAGNALVLTAIPDQIIGTVGVISTSSSYVGNTANVFTFGITNNSTSSQVINWGYTTL
jgi:hypothetical protein